MSSPEEPDLGSSDPLSRLAADITGNGEVTGDQSMQEPAIVQPSFMDELQRTEWQYAQMREPEHSYRGRQWLTKLVATYAVTRGVAIIYNKLKNNKRER